MKDYIYLIPLLPLAGAAFNLILGRKLSRAWVSLVGCGVVLAAFALSAAAVWELYDKKQVLHQSLYTWIAVGDPGHPLKIDMAFTIDHLTSVMIFIVTFIGFWIHVYSVGYMHDDPRYNTYFGYLNLFTGTMLILVLASNLPVMFIGWEGVGLCSYLLIGFWFTDEAKADAGRKAFVVNRIGDAAFLLGIFLLFASTGALDFATLNSTAMVGTPADPGPYIAPYLFGERTAMFAAVLLFIGACGKSAQIPLYVWLPDAMAGPTPVSALIHAATMVTAGVYMVARMSTLYLSSTTAMLIVATIGALTALFAAIMAFAQTDFKRVLAYSTVSQLGFMFAAVGVGAFSAGIFHLVTHAFFKAGLFLCAGSVMHAMSGSGNIMKMGGLRKYMPITHIVTLICCLAIAGIPPLSGFFSKDEILAGAWGAKHQGWLIGYGMFLWAVLSLAAIGTAFYMFRLYALVFSGDEVRCDEETKAHIHESPRSMTIPLMVLAIFAFGIGFIGLPHIGGLPNWIGEWLHKSVGVYEGEKGLTAVLPHVSQTMIVILMAVATALAALGAVTAYALYKDGPSAAVERLTSTTVGNFLYRCSLNKFWVDELYDLIIVRPFRWTARALWDFADKFVIDLIFVNGTAFVVDVFGRIARWFQNGQVQRYMAGIVIGTAVIFFFASRPTADFDYTELGNGKIELRADIGSGPGVKEAKIEWYFGGSISDGETPDAVGAKVVAPLGTPGPHPVIMRVHHPVFDKTVTVKKRIEIEGPDDGAKGSSGAGDGAKGGSGAGGGAR